MTGIDDQTPSVAATELEIEEARRYVRRKRIFYMLLGIWIALSLMWFAIDMLEGGEGTWFWPMLGTGTAVAITGVVLLGEADSWASNGSAGRSTSISAAEERTRAVTSISGERHVASMAVLTRSSRSASSVAIRVSDDP